ncbi:MAG TPA: potassium channel family protein [Candidatus Binataceae bacterium]|nr:potassium channel family protein [Candidatus Binataceae bacterium]
MKISGIWAQLGLRGHNRPGKFTVLLAALLFLLGAGPLLSNYAPTELLLTLGLSMVLLAALNAFLETRFIFVLGLVLMVPAFICKFLLLFFVRSDTLEILNMVSTIFFLGLIVVGLVGRLFTIERVTTDEISAAICAYLLMGAAWGLAYAFLAELNPASFSVPMLPGATAGLHNDAPMLRDIQKCLYYSFICLTTVGFGDITPVSAAARMLSVMEAIFGQLYMAVLIARLVGIQVAQALMKD